MAKSTRRYPSIDSGQKICTKCDTWKPLEAFPRRNTGRGCGHGSWCKSCVAKHNRRRYKQPEVRADRRARRDRWGAENLTWGIEWRQRNLERARDNGRAAAARRRARMLGLPVKPYTVAELVERDGTHCVLCNEPLDFEARHPEPSSPTVEHLECIAWPDSAGDVPSNVALAHFLCNSTRNVRPHPAAARKRAELLAAEAAASSRKRPMTTE